MILILHIAAALSSLAVTTFAFMSPSQAKLRASYALTAFTLASGTYLVVASHAALLQACTTGLLYLGAVSFGIVSVRRKLAASDHNHSE
ncbi:MAG TPA: hypothetical protein VLF43_03890 [Candidatus Saccharimonadales bacterium]|nr:hypothetical protein [Candidatus Saccharimonadales bacterium]